MDILYKFLPELNLDFGPDGFLKGIYKAIGVIVTTFLIGGLTAVLPALQSLNDPHDLQVILFTGTAIAAVKGAITWLTSRRESIEGTVPAGQLA